LIQTNQNILPKFAIIIIVVLIIVFNQADDVVEIFRGEEVHGFDRARWFGGAPKGPVASIVADLGSFDAVGVDHHVCGCAIAQGAALAGGLGALLDAGGAVNRTGWSRCGGWLHQEGAPTVRRSVNVVCHTIAGCLADALQVLSPGLAPLMGVTRVCCSVLQDAAPDVARNHGRITCRTETDASTVEKVPIATDRSVVATLVTVPHAKWGLIPANVAGAVVVTCVGTIPTHATALAVLESLIGLYILSQNPGLQHAARLAIGRAIGETGHNADNRGAIDRAEALPQDAAVVVGCHRFLGASERRAELPDPSSITHRLTHWCKLNNR
jgi:hypothetical protein